MPAKTARIDGLYSCVGSSNLDWRSFLDEINAKIPGRDFGDKMQVMFDDELAASQAIESGSRERRPLLLKFKAWVGSLLQRLL